MKIKQAMGIALTVLAILSFSSCKKQQAMPVSNEYPMMTVSRSTQTVSQEYSATVEGCNDVDVYPQVSGTITQICVKEGAHVTKGQPLFVINEVPYRAAYQSAKANVESARAQLAASKLTLESKQNLYNGKVASAYDLKQANNSYLSAKASLMQAQADLTKAANDLSYCVVKSPVTGVASMINLRVGALVSEQMSSPLITVSDDSRMYVYFSLTEKQVLAMQRDKNNASFKTVHLKLTDGSTYAKTGNIDAVSGIVDKQTGAVRVRATFVNQDHELRSGGAATVVIPQTLNDVIVIPQAATFEIQDKVYVYKVVNGKTKSTQVKATAMDDGSQYVVTEGLKAGDVIFSDGAGLVKNGMEVKAKK